MGGGVVTAALRAGLLDEVILHQVPVLLGYGRRFFQELPAHIGLSLVEAVPAPGVTPPALPNRDVRETMLEPEVERSE